MVFKAYDSDNRLVMVGGGEPPTIGENLGIRFSIARIETFSLPTVAARLAWVAAQAQQLV